MNPDVTVTTVPFKPHGRFREDPRIGEVWERRPYACEECGGPWLINPWRPGGSYHDCTDAAKAARAAGQPWPGETAESCPDCGQPG